VVDSRSSSAEDTSRSFNSSVCRPIMRIISRGTTTTGTAGSAMGDEGGALGSGASTENTRVCPQTYVHTFVCGTKVVCTGCLYVDCRRTTPSPVGGGVLPPLFRLIHPQPLMTQAKQNKERFIHRRRARSLVPRSSSLSLSLSLSLSQFLFFPPLSASPFLSLFLFL